MEGFEADGKRVLGSLMLEPLLMGAGGMILVDPLFQRLLVQVEPLRAFLGASFTLVYCVLSWIAIATSLGKPHPPR